MIVDYSELPQTKKSIEHILKHYELFKKDKEKIKKNVMIVGVSGCQGSGKTTLCETISNILRKEPYNLNVVNFSLDDLYLTHQEQIKLTEKYKDNPLYQQRGQAGSHDLKLGKEIFESLLNEKEVNIPIYDKSKHEGKGDRLNKEEWKKVKGRFDIILFEGWMIGFKPILNEKLLNKDTKIMNEELKRYEKEIYEYFDIFIHLSPLNIQQVYNWRLEQEKKMKEIRGVKGLSDEKVKLFVDSYMPAYELYLPRLNKVGFFNQGYLGEKLKKYEGNKRKDGGYSKSNKHLRFILDKDRKVIQINTIKEISNSRSISIIYPLFAIGFISLIGYYHKPIFNFINKKN